MLKNCIATIWLLACVAFLALYLTANEPEPEMWWLMVFLTFPIGFGLMPLMGWVSMGLSLEIPGVVYWLLLTAGGYWQWFIIVPRIVRRYRSTV